eukprot:303332-Hanusia_phi.AAC.1
MLPLQARGRPVLSVETLDFQVPHKKRWSLTTSPGGVPSQQKKEMVCGLPVVINAGTNEQPGNAQPHSKLLGAGTKGRPDMQTS